MGLIFSLWISYLTCMVAQSAKNLITRNTVCSCATKICMFFSLYFASDVEVVIGQGEVD